MVKKKLQNKREKSRKLDNLRSQIENTQFHRYIAHDMEGYERHVKRGGVELYSKKEMEEIRESGANDRLPPRATSYYMDLASRSDSITNLIKARPEETDDLSGAKDPSNQLKYSPVPGLLHKYELILLYVVRVCSSWCRYCYRSDFLTSKTEKDIAGITEITDYIKSHNKKIVENRTAENRDLHILESGADEFPIREALLSGGDPMVLSNKNLFEYFYGLADAGVRTIRIGTKELAFFPQRFDENFFNMIDLFHELHPDVNLAIMTHFSHSDELLEKDKDRNYVVLLTGQYKRIEVTEKAIQNLRSRSYVTLENQAPIIEGVNDDALSLRRLQIELKRIGINNHYFFQCRDIEGHKVFAAPLEETWRVHRDSQKGLSGIEKSRFVMSTEDGKLEVVSVIEKPDFETLGVDLPEQTKAIIDSVIGEGLVIFKAHRVPQTEWQGDLIIARSNPEALWITGYEDRIIYDGRKEGNDKWSPMGNLLKTLLAPVIDVTKAEEVLSETIH